MIKKLSKNACVAFAIFALAGVGKVHAEETKDVPAPTVSPAPVGGEIWADSSRIKKSGNYEYHRKLSRLI